jgi:hypothetical protein
MNDEWERMREAMWLVQVSGSPKADFPALGIKVLVG